MTENIEIDAKLMIGPILSEQICEEKLRDIGISLNPSPIPQIVVLSYDHEGFYESIKHLMNQGVHLFVISDLADEENVNKILFELKVQHIIGVGPYLIDELAQNLKKYKYGNHWGVEKNLDEDALINATQIFHSKDIDKEFNSIVKNLDLSQFFKSPLDYLRVIANELGTNAFFHMRDTPSTNRRDSIFLTDQDGINMKVGVDSKRIALSVSDSTGALDFEKVINSLERCFKEKKPLNRKGHGAGLGLYMVFSHANQLIINVDQDTTTEVIAIIDANKRYLNYKKRVTSFHFFSTSLKVKKLKSDKIDQTRDIKDTA